MCYTLKKLCYIIKSKVKINLKYGFKKKSFKIIKFCEKIELSFNFILNLENAITKQY